MSYLDDLRQKLNLKVELPVSYYFKPARKQTNKTVILLHGYQDSASSLFRRCFGDEEKDYDFNILAPNGIYPVPVKTDDGFREAYAWYFVDGKRKFTLVPAEVAAANLISLLEQLKIRTHTFLLVGFSQGGILASFVAHELRDLKGIIGLGTMFFAEYYAGLSELLPVDSIHGVDDDVITLKTSKSGYDELKSLQPRPGNYYPIKGLKHTLDDEARAKLLELIEVRLLEKK